MWLLHLIISIKSEVSTLAIAVIFFIGCASDVVVPVYAVDRLLHTDTGKSGLVFPLLSYNVKCVQKCVHHFGQQVVFGCLHFVLSFYHNYAGLCKRIQYGTCGQVYSIKCVSVGLITFSQLFYAIYGPLWFHFVHIRLWECLQFILLSSSNWKYEWISIHCLWFYNDTKVCALYIAIFLYFCLLRVSFTQKPYLTTVWHCIETKMARQQNGLFAVPILFKRMITLLPCLCDCSDSYSKMIWS